MPDDDRSDEHRRQGRADAVVRIVLSRTTPLISAERWCEVLDLERKHVEEALVRLRAHPTRPLFDLPAAPLDLASLRRREYRKAHKADRRRLPHPRRNRMTECEFCDKSVMLGKNMDKHRALHHPDEWAARLAADIMADYRDLECPDCGAPMIVKVTIEIERTCSCHAEPTYWCYRGDCQQDVPFDQVEAHQREHIRVLADSLAKGLLAPLPKAS